MSNKPAPEAVNDHNFEPTPDSGYVFEGKTTMRNSNGWGGTQTRLPEGHLARRDVQPMTKRVLKSQ